ncbi:MAG: alpha/beta hydrolase domain-containing protein, partial [Burkholderiales bacterium]
MLLKKRTTFSRRAAWLGVASTAALLTCASPAQARVTRIIVDAVAPISGQPYEMLTGRAFGELDPGDTHNTLITDIAAAPKNTNGKVEYIASFVLRKPTDMSTASGVMWHDVPNRGGDVAFPTDSFAAKDVHLLSGWQGDNAGATSVPVNASSLAPIALIGHHWVQVPKLVGVTGTIFGRIVNRSGLNAAPLNVMGNPIPYFPVNAADNTGATLTTHTHETIDGVVTVGEVIPNSQWKFCGGGTFASPTPVTTLPVQVCMMNGFDPAKLYELVYAVKDPYVLGAGTAAFRDVNSFFKYELMDDFGTLNPVANKIKWSIVRGSSQSGNFTRHFIFLGMNQDESNRIGHEGAWPLIAGRRVANNSRWGQPDGVLELYQMGSEGPQWWTAWPDVVRGLPTAGILDRCTASSTCPKIIETFGGAEVFALKMTTSWVGTSADTDIPVPRNVRRYYLPSSTHGGGNGA